MKISMAGNRVRTGVLVALSMVASLVVVSPALSQVTSTVRVSNLGQPSVDRRMAVGSNEKYAQSFCSGSVAVTLDKVRLRVQSYDVEGNMMGRTERPEPVVTLRSDNSGKPGGVLHTLTNPVIDNSQVADKDFTSTGYELAADTVYWVVLPSAKRHRPHCLRRYGIQL